MTTRLDPTVLDVILASLDGDREQAVKHYAQLQHRLVGLFERHGLGSAEDLADETLDQVADLCGKKIMDGLVPPSEAFVFISGMARWHSLAMLKQRGREDMNRGVLPRTAREQNAVYAQELPPPPLDRLGHLLQTYFPVLFAQVLEPTLADLREEHFAVLAEGRPLKAQCVLLRGCGALAAAAICQLGFSLLGRIAALWQARSPK